MTKAGDRGDGGRRGDRAKGMLPWIRGQARLGGQGVSTILESRWGASMDVVYGQWRRRRKGFCGVGGGAPVVALRRRCCGCARVEEEEYKLVLTLGLGLL